MTPHEQIIADHRKRATDLRERAVDRDCEAAELRALASAEDAAADYLEHGLAAEAVPTAQAAPGAGDIHEPDGEPGSGHGSLRPEDIEHDAEQGEAIGEITGQTIVPPPPAVMDWAREQPGSGHGSPAQTAPEAAASIIAGEEEPRLKTYPRDLVEKPGFGRQKVEAAE